MNQQRIYKIVLLPEMEVVEQGCTLSEAATWIGAYNEILRGEPAQAVIAQQTPASPADN